MADFLSLKELLKRQEEETRAWIETYQIDRAVAAVFRHNDEIPIDDYPAIRSSASAFKAVEEGLTLRLEILDAALWTLYGQTEYVQKCHEMHLSAFAPIRKVPSEILNQIFLDACTDNEGCYPVLLDVSSTPWVLARVCRKWRDIVANGPLWTQIRIPKGNPSFKMDGDRFQDILSEILRRSCGRPIHLTVTPRMITHPGIMSLLDAHSDHMEGVQVYATRTIWPRFAALSLPSLQYLEIVDAEDKETGSQPRSLGFPNAPELHSLTMVLPELPQIVLSRRSFTPDDFSVPYQQLRHFSVIHPSILISEPLPLSFFRCLLQWLYLDTYEQWSEDGRGALPSAAIQRHCLPRIKKLITSNIHLLRCLNLPSLKHLGVGQNLPTNLASKNDPPTSNRNEPHRVCLMDCTIDMLNASGCNLSFLRLYNVALTQHFLPFLHTLNTLETLELVIPDKHWNRVDDNAVLTQFFLDLGAELTFLPSLKVLDVRVVPPSHPPAAAITTATIGVKFTFISATLAQAIASRSHLLRSFTLSLRAQDVSWDLSQEEEAKLRSMYFVRVVRTTDVRY